MNTIETAKTKPAEKEIEDAAAKLGIDDVPSAAYAWWGVYHARRQHDALPTEWTASRRDYAKVLRDSIRDFRRYWGRDPRDVCPTP